ncbi:MAG: hypothetical protein JWN48_19 [Myxococcaceae bacterium]|nr:hypothetical protein [Myxococcaceae bacterium]
MNGKNWDQLFSSFSQRKRVQAARREVSRELVAWYEEQIQLIMTLVREVASERAAAFKESAGVSIEVQWPSHPPINVDPDGPFMSFMCLRLPEREVHLYSHRIGSDEPLIHFVVAGPEGPDRQRKRLLSKPGCRIERREGGGFLLRGVGVGSLGGLDGQGVVSVDDLAFRAFELLLSEP